ncbi:MAG TPA: SCO family protein [Aestuariivirga sp.]|nr:SCO family protein [Aestuariivirga sp.]
MKKSGLFSLVLVAAAAIIAAVLMTFGLQGSGTSGKLTADIGGPFKLMSSNGAVIDSTTLKGKPYAVYFGFTHCPEVCPTTMAEMTEAYEKLGDAAKDFTTFFVTVDPERDTVEFLHDYLLTFDKRFVGLVPTMEELPVIAKNFRAVYEKVPTSDGSYTMNHTASVYLFDGDGKLTATLGYGEPEKARMAKLRKLLGVASPAS